MTDEVRMIRRVQLEEQLGEFIAGHSEVAAACRRSGVSARRLTEDVWSKLVPVRMVDCSEEGPKRVRSALLSAVLLIFVVEAIWFVATWWDVLS